MARLTIVCQTSPHYSGGGLWLTRHTLPDGASLPLALRNVAPTNRLPASWPIDGAAPDWSDNPHGRPWGPGPLARAGR